jgi:2-polyprenyl-6-methoxyphenol hydroxylase-like FAD-dependent oxidoreductase
MAASVSLNVTIVGAGIAGLATAIALKRAGHKVKVCTSLLISLVPNYGLADHTRRSLRSRLSQATLALLYLLPRTVPRS